MTAVTTDTHRGDMIRRLEAGQAYEFLTLAAPYVDACPDDHFIRLMAIREYLKLGLIPPAKELLDVDWASPELPADLESIRISLADVAGKSIPWSALSGRFESNLASLDGRGVDIQEIRAAWAKAQPYFELFRDCRGFDQVRMRNEAGRWRWYPRLGDHRAYAEAYPLPSDAQSHTPGPYLFEGLDLGWHFMRLYDVTCDSFVGFSCALFVVEPDPAALAIVLHLQDWGRLLSDPRVFWLIGDDCVERLTQAFEADLDLPWPRQAFRMSGPRRVDAPGAVAALEAAGKQREAAVKRSLADVEKRYEARDRTHWSKRYAAAFSGEQAPLRILAAVSTHTTFLQYSMRDAKRAFESLGHQFVLLTEGTPYSVISPLTYHNAILDLDPDLFFNIDHIRPEFEGIIPKNLPIFTWDQDQLPQVFTRKNIEQIGRSDFVAGCSKNKCLMLGARSEQMVQAHIPTCENRFGGEPLTKRELARYACDVSFVSHAAQTSKEFHEEERAACNHAPLVRIMDELFEAAPAMLAEHRIMSGNLAEFMIEEASRRCRLVINDEDVRHWLRGWYLWRLADRIFRHEALEWVGHWANRTGRSFRIYGKGWDKHPTLSPFSTGPAENGRELICVYRASTINLQLMPAGFIHQRALDGLAAGGFFLGRKTPNDVRGRVLRRLDARIRELGIETTADLLDATDGDLRELLHAYLGHWLHRVDRGADQLIDTIHVAAEVLYPDEIFSDFEEVIFDSADEYVGAAERFLADEPRRRQTVERMRGVVLEHFSYRPTMERFLAAMAEYLSGARTSAPEPITT